jgi:hypothetical protein
MVGDIVGVLAERGYAVAPGAARVALRAAAGLEGSVVAPDSPTFTSTARDAGRAARVGTAERVRALLAPVIAGLVGPVQVFLAGIVHKGPSAPALPFHQDLSYTDERRFRSFTCWVPLVDVGRATGALAVVPRSHTWNPGVRASGPGALHIPPPVQRQLRRRAEVLELAAGDVVVWDNALAHASLPNRSEGGRPALAAVFTSPDAALLYYHAEIGCHPAGYVIDDGYLGVDDPFGADPAGYPPAPAWSAPAPALRLPG